MFRNTNKFCRNKFLELGCVVGECNIGNDIPMEFENDMTVNENAVTYKEKSPFGKHYEQMYLKCKTQIKDIEDDSEVRTANKCYFPSVIDFFVTF